MISDLDIWRAAHLLIRKHGANAKLEAVRLQDLMLDCDVEGGRRVWQRIGPAIEALQTPRRGKPHSGAAMGEGLEKSKRSKRYLDRTRAALKFG
jgi:hypothetical protein